MNAIFSILFLFSLCVLLFLSPDHFLSILLEGASGAGTLSVAILASYCIWLGLMRVWEKLGVAKKIARLFRPIVKKLFRIEGEESVEAVSMNLSANLLGLGNAATPYGITAVERLKEEKDSEFALTMLFVLNAGSLQLIPSSVITLRASLQSVAPSDIFLPCLLSTILSTFLGVCLTFLFARKKRTRISYQPRRMGRAGAR